MSKRTPIYPAYESETGAKLVDFAGWDMPLQFARGILGEHRAVRGSVGLFDVSHMGEIELSGRGARTLLDRLITIDVDRIRVGRGRYTMLCNETGGVIDDCVVFSLASDRFLMVVNASNKDRVYSWMSRQDPSGLARDVSAEYCMVALQGPSAAELLRSASPDGDANLPRFGTLLDTEVSGVPAIVTRTGYTGEDGFEIMCSSAAGPALWRGLATSVGEAGGALCGLGARDSLRFEASLPLHGHELSESISPLEAGLQRYVDLEKGEFVGQGALRQQAAQGTRRRSLGCQMLDTGVPREGCEVFREGRRIGIVTSGMKALSLGTFNAMILVDSGSAALDDEIEIEIHAKLRRGRVVTMPFYSATKREVHTGGK